MDVLQALASRPGEVVAKERLIEEVWAREFIADSALSRAVFELRDALGDDSHHPSYIETIAKRGYRLMAPVNAVDAQAAEPGGPPRRVRQLRAAVWALPLLAAAGSLALVNGFRTPPSDQPAKWRMKVAILPFENLGHAEDEYLAAGITDEISNRLASVPGLGVVAVPRTNRSVGPTRPPGAVGRDLQVDCVLRGTVRWQPQQGKPSRVRVSPSLADVANGRCC